MLDVLAAAIEATEIHADEHELAEALSLRDRLDAKIAHAVGAFDAAELWDEDGSASMVAWLRAHARRTNRDAQRLTVTARKLRSLPGVAAAARGGTISGGQVDAIVATVTDGASTILDYGRTTRTITPAVYTSLVLRDLGCRYPGCDRPPDWCEGHHVQPWEHGGPTCLSNLVLLCSRHHHRVHLRGWQLELLGEATVEVTTPDGVVRTGHPPRRRTG